MRPDDKDKLNKCIEILDSTDLGASLTWLYVWDMIKTYSNDSAYDVTVTEDELWEYLVAYTDSKDGFSLEYGGEALSEHVLEWMITNGYIIDNTEDLVYEDD